MIKKLSVTGRKRLILLSIICAISIAAAGTALLVLAGTGSKKTTPAMILVNAGSFLMGRENGPPGEAPVHAVSISRDFFIAVYPITCDDYESYVSQSGKRKPQYPGEGRKPVMGVNWFEAIAYCNWLSLRDGLEPCYSGAGISTKCDFLADGYRLPTEAEWEYAARGGHLAAGSSATSLYAGSENPGDVAWFDMNSGGKTQITGLKKPNQLGVFDMCGNLYEWCWDWYGSNYYLESPEIDPRGPPPPVTTLPWKQERSRRGGCWREGSDNITVASRSQDYVYYRGDNGFRIVRTAVAKP